jgi:sirohydrochlorin cobaltochelatase
VAHGTDLNENSSVAAKREAEKIRALHRYASVLNVYMEETPLVSEWEKLTRTKNVIVVPFFIADGLHSYEDIPALLGIAKNGAGRSAQSVFAGNPYRINDRALYYSSAFGTDPGMANIVVEQASKFYGKS